MEINELSNMLHRLRSIEQQLTQQFEKKTGFSLTRYEILTFLNNHNFCNQMDIQQFMQIDRAAITRHLKILETKGYVNRKRNEANAREVIVSLTDYGKSTLEKCQMNHCSESCNLPINIDKDHMKALMELMDIIQNSDIKGEN